MEGILPSLLTDPYRPFLSVMYSLYGHHAALKILNEMRHDVISAAVLSSSFRAVIEAYVAGGRGSRASPLTQDALLEKQWSETMVIQKQYCHPVLAHCIPPASTGSDDTSGGMNAPLHRISRLVDMLRNGPAGAESGEGSLGDALGAMQEVTLGASRAF